MCFSFLHLRANLINHFKYFNIFNMVGIISVGVKNIFPLMKWGNIFHLIIDSFSSLMTFHLIIDSFSSLMTFHLVFSSIGLELFIYLIGAPIVSKPWCVKIIHDYLHIFCQTKSSLFFHRQPTLPNNY